MPLPREEIANSALCRDRVEPRALTGSGLSSALSGPRPARDTMHTLCNHRAVWTTVKRHNTTSH